MSTVREVLNHYGIDYEEIPYSRSDLFYYCPFHTHSDNKMGSSRFDEDQELFNCFACGNGGNIYQFVMKMENCDFRVAKQLVENNFQDLNTYDIATLTERLNRKFVIMSKDLSKTEQEIVDKMLHALAMERPPLPVIFSWMPIFTYVMNSKLNQKSLLDLYGEFLQEVKNNKPQIMES